MWTDLCEVKDEDRDLRTLQGAVRHKYRKMVQ